MFYLIQIFLFVWCKDSRLCREDAILLYTDNCNFYYIYSSIITNDITSINIWEIETSGSLFCFLGDIFKDIKMDYCAITRQKFLTTPPLRQAPVKIYFHFHWRLELSIVHYESKIQEVSFCRPNNTWSNPVVPNNSSNISSLYDLLLIFIMRQSDAGCWMPGYDSAAF